MRFVLKAKKLLLAHPYISGAAAVVLIGGGLFIHGKVSAGTSQTRYVLGTVATGTIVSSVSASGQIDASDSVDIKPQVTGTITWVGVKAGQSVRAGQALMTIDSTDAKQALESAKKSLAADKLTYQKSSAQAPIDYQNDVQALANAKDTLSNDYNSVYNDLSDVYLGLPDVMNGAESTLYGYDFDRLRSQWNMDVLVNLFTDPAHSAKAQDFRTTAKNDYTSANSAYEASADAYTKTSRSSDPAAIDALLLQSITMTTSVAQALQSELNFFGGVSNLAQTDALSLPNNFATVQSSARSYLSTANSDVSKLLADKKMLENDKQAITNAEQQITLDQVGNPDGSNPISLQVSANSIAKEEQDIANQEADLAKYTVVAPFSGVLSAVNFNVGDSSSGTAASIISNTRVATLSLNEVDAAKVKIGQKASLTFDAIEDLSLTGTVAEIDSVGAVSQGVVSYEVKISLDTQDSRIKPGMTVNAEIQTGVAQNALVVPQSAVKTQNGESYVMVFDPALENTGDSSGVISSVPPSMVPVTIGLSDNTKVQVLSGLSAGQQIVTSTKSGAAASATSARITGAAGAARGGLGGGATFRAF